MIESIGGDGRTYKLVDEQGEPAVLNTYYPVNGVSYKLEGGRPPQHEGSTGKVWARPDGGGQRELYPQLLGLNWA